MQPGSIYRELWHLLLLEVSHRLLFLSSSKNMNHISIDSAFHELRFLAHFNVEHIT